MCPSLTFSKENLMVLQPVYIWTSKVQPFIIHGKVNTEIFTLWMGIQMYEEFNLATWI